MASSSPFAGVRIITPEAQGALVLSNSVSHAMGTTALLLTRPTTSSSPFAPEKHTLYMAADVGGWRVRLGDYTGQAFDQTKLSTANDTIEITTHGYSTGDGPFRLTIDGGTIATGLAVDTDYWIIEGASADLFQVATSYANAMAGTEEDISVAGTADYTIGGASHGATPASDGYGWADTLQPSVAAAAATDDYNSILIGEGFTAIASAPSDITVVAFNATDVLTYWWG